jgi:hypothetical protein
MKPRKFDGHTSAACVNRDCQAFYMIDQMVGWQEVKALDALETEAILALARIERERCLEKIKHTAENRLKRLARANKVPIGIASTTSPGSVKATT